MKQLKRLYYKLFKHYDRLECKFVSYSEGDRLIKDGANKLEEYQWVIAREEDFNTCLGWVHLERRRRIYE